MKLRLFILFLALFCLFSSAASGKSIVDAALSEVNLIFNGKPASLGSDFKIINFNGYTYVPIRWIVEKMGGKLDYDANANAIYIQDDAGQMVIDPRMPEIYLTSVRSETNGSRTLIKGNLHLTSNDNDSKAVAGLMSFYKSNGQKIGSIILSGNYTSGVHLFELTGDHIGDQDYSAVTLQMTLDQPEQSPTIGEPVSVREITPLLDHFYTAYINKEYEKLIEYSTEKNDYDRPYQDRQASVAQYYINSRHWYGDIRGYQIIIVNDISDHEKEVAVAVTMNDKTTRYVDTLRLLKQNGEWLISEYMSGAPAPELP